MMLIKDYIFSGRIKIEGKWLTTPILLQENLTLHIFLPGVYHSNNETKIPETIEGQIDGWDLQLNDGASWVSWRHDTFNSLMSKNKFSDDEISFVPLNDHQKIWTEMSLIPNTCTFVKCNSTNDIPDEWGLTFYPDDRNRALFYLFDGNLNAGKPPDILSSVDYSHYFENSEKWSLKDMISRLKLITSCLSLFAGAPITYQLLIGKHGKDIFCFQIKNVSNPNAYICQSAYNGHIGIKDNFLSGFSSRLIKQIEIIYSGDNSKKTGVILSFFNILYQNSFDEAKIAFSFMIMESLSKLKGRPLKIERKLRTILEEIRCDLCQSCRLVIEPIIQVHSREATGEFDELIKKAIDVIDTDKQLNVTSKTMREIMMQYRDKVFHGDFFENMDQVNKMISALPEGYRNDLPIVFEAIVSAIAAYLIFGIGFEEMTALKRSFISKRKD